MKVRNDGQFTVLKYIDFRDLLRLTAVCTVTEKVDSKAMFLNRRAAAQYRALVL
jgi:hypothetical protein